MTGGVEGSISGDSDDSRFTITYDDQEDGEAEEQEAEPAGTSSPISNRTRNKTAQKAQLSPRERKRRKAQAVKRDKQGNRAGNWDIKRRDGSWRRPKEGEAEMLDSLVRQGEEGLTKFVLLNFMFQGM